jgi:FMN reductase (NADPH)/FMN reductase [NAD(P)H]
MMNPVLETIHQRKSVRAYEDKPLPEDVRDMILKSAMRAPTAGNMMLYSIIEVSDQEAKNKLVETCDNQPACCDALIAAQTAVIAAESLGVGSCYIGDILENYEIHREMFNMPQYAVPICMVCFGYPSVEQKERKRTKRFDEEFIVYKNRYRRLGEEEFKEMYASTHERMMAGSAERRDQPSVGIRMYKRKFSAEYAVEMRRSVRAILEAWVA